MPRGDFYRQKYAKKRRNSDRSKERTATPLNVQSFEYLSTLLRSLDRKNYGAYHALKGCFAYENQDILQFRLEFDHIQSDPYASPSRAHLRLLCATFPREMFCNSIRRIALCDYLARRFAEAVGKIRNRPSRGVKGGDIRFTELGQHVLERSCVCVEDDGTLEVRFHVGLPAQGRSICGEYAKTVLTETLPRIVEKALVLSSLNADHLWAHIRSIEDQEALRKGLRSANLVAFIRNGAILPRESGARDLPMDVNTAVPFQSPPSMEITRDLPNSGQVRGMGIPKGVTLFVGGGFHGKSTILKALEVGIYNHIPTDGREFVVVDESAVKIRSEDARHVSNCDISSFIDNLPFEKDVTRFCTSDASGSTSQAANIMEALEVGACTLLFDEDTCATNFMIRDFKMQQLVPKEKEPITPFITKVRALYEQQKVSSILVIGGAGDYFFVADRVIMMNAYMAHDMTQRAKKIADQYRPIDQSEEFKSYQDRVPLPAGFMPDGKLMARALQLIQFGDIDLQLSAVEQLVEMGQTRAIADAILRCTHWMDGKRTLFQVLQCLEDEIDTKSLDCLGSVSHPGNYARPRRYEIAASLNRLRSASFQQQY